MLIKQYKTKKGLIHVIKHQDSYLVYVYDDKSVTVSDFTYKNAALRYAEKLNLISKEELFNDIKQGLEDRLKGDK
jgi:hypothetical protein